MEVLIADNAYVPNNLVVGLLNHIRGMRQSNLITRRAVGLIEKTGMAMNAWSMKCAVMSLAYSGDIDGVLAMERKMLHFPDTLSDPLLLCKLLHAHLILGHVDYVFSLYESLKNSGEDCVPSNQILCELLHSLEEPPLFSMPMQSQDVARTSMNFRSEKEAALLSGKLKASAFVHLLLHHFVSTSPPSSMECDTMIYHFTRETDPVRVTASRVKSSSDKEASGGNPSSGDQELIKVEEMVGVEGEEEGGVETEEEEDQPLIISSKECEMALWSQSLLRLLSMGSLTAVIPPESLIRGVIGLLDSAGLTSHTPGNVNKDIQHTMAMYREAYCFTAWSTLNSLSAHTYLGPGALLLREALKGSVLAHPASLPECGGASSDSLRAVMHAAPWATLNDVSGGFCVCGGGGCRAAGEPS